VAKVICLFNHKGGVSKTTTAFNLGWMLARKKKRVLLVDCDPQCNLTGMVLGLEDLETADSIQGTKNGKPLNIKEGLAPAFESRPSPIQPVECLSIPKNKNLFLMPGPTPRRSMGASSASPSWSSTLGGLPALSSPDVGPSSKLATSTKTIRSSRSLNAAAT
jgi:Mrp family chromosome partitioning ATPase